MRCHDNPKRTNKTKRLSHTIGWTENECNINCYTIYELNVHKYFSCRRQYSWLVWERLFSYRFCLGFVFFRFQSFNIQTYMLHVVVFEIQIPSWIKKVILLALRNCQPDAEGLNGEWTKQIRPITSVTGSEASVAKQPWTCKDLNTWIIKTLLCKLV